MNLDRACLRDRHNVPITGPAGVDKTCLAGGCRLFSAKA